jgi:hypothetical protein
MATDGWSVVVEFPAPYTFEEDVALQVRAKSQDHKRFQGH